MRPQYWGNSEKSKVLGFHPRSHFFTSASAYRGTSGATPGVTWGSLGESPGKDYQSHPGVTPGVHWPGMIFPLSDQMMFFLG